MTALTIGREKIGDEPIAGSVLWDKPVIALTAPVGTIDTGPTVTVTWTYSQAQSKAQNQYRVRVTDDLDTTDYYDSGWLHSAATSHDIDWDALELPGDSADVAIQLSVIGAITWTIYDEEEIISEMGVPHCTITAPSDGSVWSDVDSVDVSWTFTDDVAGRTQAQYRVRILDRVSDIELYDTGWVVSTATTVEVPYAPTDGQLLTVELQLKNDAGMRSD